MSASSKSFPLPVQLVFRKNFMLKHCFGAVFFCFNLTKSGRHDQPQSGSFLEGVIKREDPWDREAEWHASPSKHFNRYSPKHFNRFPLHQQFCGTHLRSLLERGTVRVERLALQNNIITHSDADLLSWRPEH